MPHPWLCQQPDNCFKARDTMHYKGGADSAWTCQTKEMTENHQCLPREELIKVNGSLQPRIAGERGRAPEVLGAQDKLWWSSRLNGTNEGDKEAHHPGPQRCVNHL